MLRRKWHRFGLSHFLWGLALAVCGLVITFLFSSTAFWIADKVESYVLGVLCWWSGWVLLLTALAWAMDNL